MAFPIAPPIEPMLAKLTDALPPGEGWLFEPKWDGFRAIVFKDGDEVYIQSRDRKPLNRYFPDLEEILRAALPARVVLDGEIVIATPDGLDFDALQLRIHPAASRVKKLAEEMPSSFVAFDLLALDDRDLRDLPQAERRTRLEQALRGVSRARSRDALQPRPRDRAGVVRPLRGRGARRRDRQARVAHLPAGQARDGQGQARAHRRLRGGRVPLAQERPGHAHRLAAARALRREGRAASCRRDVVLPDGAASARWSRSWRRCARARWPRTRGASGRR